MFVSIQAKILTITALITLVVSFILSLRTNGIFAIVSFVFGVLVMLLAILDQDCVVLGGCNTWAWVKLVIGMLALVIPLGVTIYNAGKEIEPSSKKEEDIKKELDLRKNPLGFM